MASKCIHIRGAREHNLAAVNIDIPRDQLVVITGLSGSGKSSLAFDTIYAEGQRKYMESLSAYARQFLDQLRKPDIESIEGLPPTIAIEQRSASHNPRSTVATTTEIYDYLRLLFARVGQPRCWHVDVQGKVCGHPIASQSATAIVDKVLAMQEGAKLMVLSPLVRGKKGHHKEIFASMVRQGFVRARVDGATIDLRELGAAGTPFTTKTERYQQHDIEAVVDRIIVRKGDDESAGTTRSRVADSIELALKLSGGLVIISELPTEGASAAASSGDAHAATSPKPETRNPKPDHVDHLFSEHYSCPMHPECSLQDMEPRLFSFNSPHGACPACSGIGRIMEFDADLIVPNGDLTLSKGAIEPWRYGAAQILYNRMLRRFCRDFKVDPDTPFKKLPKTATRILLQGTSPRDEKQYGKYFEGVLPNLQRRMQNTESESLSAYLSQYLSEAPCETCHGARLRNEALHVYVEAEGSSAVNISQVTALTIEHANDLFSRLRLSAEHEQIAAPILKEVRARLGFMMNVGLGYLNLNRATGTLSGGEAQRIRLATQVGAGLVGCCYVLDEPTIGLHQRDNDRLIATLRHLTDIGNTVIVVEHDEDTIRAADHLIDIGPGPGKHGGRVIAQGTVDDIINHSTSITGAFLSGRREITTPATVARRPLSESKAITVKGARQNNLKGIDVAFPLGGFVCVTGVSGSGKSTLVNQILLRGARRHLLGSRDKPGDHDKILGLNSVDRIIEVDQSPIGRTPRSNPATYTGAFDAVRALFTQTKEAKIRGYKPGRFSFNVKGGRCEECQGQGVKKIEMHFLPDVFVTCETCKGSRYNRETLEVHYRGKTIADVLDMTIEEAIAFFANIPTVLPMLQALSDVGLDYMHVGQASTTLSGGEAQRVKLATELGKRATGHTLYILDEPTTGLHFADIEKLLSVLQRLADAGNTIVVIEHNMDVIKCADWLIDLGPEGGDRGGTLVASGPPEAIVANKASYTGHYLKTHLKPVRRSKASA